MNIFVAGHRGFIGSHLIAIGCKPYDLDTEVLPKDSVIVNCLAKSSHNYCEENPYEAYCSNVFELSTLLAKWGAPSSQSVPILHLSSDYVFDGFSSQ